MAQEVWGHSAHLFDFHPDQGDWGRNQDYDTPESNSERHQQEKMLGHLWRAVARHDRENGSVRDIEITHHMNGNRHFTSVNTGERNDGEHLGDTAWDHIQHESNLVTKPLGHRITDAVRGLIHVPQIAADKLEDMGHNELAHLLRTGTIAQEYHGYDSANHPDIAFIHNRRHHAVIRDASGKKRYHFVGESIDE